jgi:hypothetical protein
MIRKNSLAIDSGKESLSQVFDLRTTFIGIFSGTGAVAECYDLDFQDFWYIQQFVTCFKFSASDYTGKNSFFGHHAIADFPIN